jgi:ComF family protein
MSLFAYQTPVAGMIKQFKDHAGFSEARCFGKLMSAAFTQYYLEQDIALPALLLPVPLHSTRVRQRGFNQAIMLCNTISARTGITVLRHACERRPSQHTQRGLGAQARQLNMQGVFYNGKQAHLTAAKHIAIIDDVVTTTATVNAMSAVLRRQGSTRIDIWSVARAN